MYKEAEIIAWASEYGLGALTEIEKEYISAQSAYNYYAASSSMSYGMAQDAGDAWREFKAVSTPDRIAAVNGFIKALSGD